MSAEANRDPKKFQGTFILDAQGLEACWKDEKVQASLQLDAVEKTKVKKLARLGIPDTIKGITNAINVPGTVYSKILGLDKVPRYERDFQQGLSRAHGNIIPEQPLPPTFGGKPHIQSLALGRPGVFLMDHVLCIVAHDFPNVEYCPFLCPLVSMLCHHLGDPDDILAATTVILKKCFSGGDQADLWTFFPVNHQGILQMSKAFGYLLSRKNYKVYKHLQRLRSPDGEHLWLEWLVDFFIYQLPQPLVWRILDCFLVEGYKTLFRVGVAYSVFMKDAILSAESDRDLDKALNPSALAPSLYDAFMKAVWNVSFSRSDLNKPNFVQSQSIEDLMGSMHTLRAKPRMATESDILTELHWIPLWSWIPVSRRHSELNLLFTTKEHGYNLGTMIKMTLGIKPMILIVQTLNKGIFGAYLSDAWAETDQDRGRFIGTGETFLFILEPFAKMYPWVGRVEDSPNTAVSSVTPLFMEHNPQSSMFIMSDKKQIAIGGGGEFGLWLNNSLTSGTTGKCLTFANDPLTGTKETRFECAAVEVFGFNL